MSSHKEPSEEAPHSTPPSGIRGAIKTAIADFIASLKSTPKVIKDSSIETFSSIRSPDQPTRKASILFIVFLLCAFLVVVKAVQLTLVSYRVQKVELQKLAEIEAEKAVQAEIEKKKLLPPVYMSLGTFVLELRERPGNLKAKNSLNSAEFEIVITCDEAELCEWIKENIPLARAELGPLFVPMERDRLLTIQGKRAFREEIRDQLNRFVEKKSKKGSVLEVLFPRFIMS